MRPAAHLLTSAAVATAKRQDLADVERRARPQLVIKTTRITLRAGIDWVGRYNENRRRLGFCIYRSDHSAAASYAASALDAADKAFLAWVKREYGGDFGVYAEVIHEGECLGARPSGVASDV